MTHISRIVPARAYRTTAPAGTFLSDDDIRRVAPSVFATAAH